MADLDTLRQRALERLAMERQWMADHGTTRYAYRERYGLSTDEDHYGDGGDAIYEADLAALNHAQDALLEIEARIRRRDRLAAGRARIEAISESDPL